jgi:hypothetical protein
MVERLDSGVSLPPAATVSAGARRRRGITGANPDGRKADGGGTFLDGDGFSLELYCVCTVQRALLETGSVGWNHR